MSCESALFLNFHWAFRVSMLIRSKRHPAAGAARFSVGRSNNFEEFCMSILTQPEGFITGMAAKMFIVAGPVIVFGTAASVVYGIVLLLV